MTIQIATRILEAVNEMQAAGVKDAETINAIIDIIDPVHPFRVATSAELFKALGATPKVAERQERELNAIIRRQSMEVVQPMTPSDGGEAA